MGLRRLSRRQGGRRPFPSSFHPVIPALPGLFPEFCSVSRQEGSADTSDFSALAAPYNQLHIPSTPGQRITEGGPSIRA